MITSQLLYSPENNWENVQEKSKEINPTLAIIFGSTQLIKEGKAVKLLKEKFPETVFIGGTTAGEICGTTVNDGTLVATLIEFEKSTISYVSEPISKASDSFLTGQNLVEKLPKEDLKHVFVISEGLTINGSELVNGMRSKTPRMVRITGGLAADGPNFSETYTISESGEAQKNHVTAIGFYGKNLRISYGSMGGWDSFGVERLVTKSNNNVLYELDGKPALALYKTFLGELASELPSSGLLFPLNLRIEKDSEPVVRTILGVDEATQSLTFAGDIPEGSHVRLMKANFDRLIEGASGAAKNSLLNFPGQTPSLSILISCVGRKLVLKQIIEEEVEAVAEVLGKQTTLCGFYSYGEISPFSPEAKCELHNQTMTITSFSETI